MVNEHEVFFHYNYLQPLLKDLREARSSVILQSPFLAMGELGRVLPEIQSCIDRRVRVCVRIQKEDPSYDQDEEDVARTEECVLRLLELGDIHIMRVPLIHEKLALFDERSAWEGSLNYLSHQKTTERLNRWICPAKFWEIVKSHNLDSCSGCADVSGYCQTHPDIVRAQRLQLGRVIYRRRKDLGLSQEKLAERVGLRQPDISVIEASDGNVNLNKVIEICVALRIGLRGLPWFLLPATDKAVLNPVPATYFNPEAQAKRKKSTG